MNTFIEKLIIFVLGIIVIPAIIYNTLGLLTGYNGNFDQIIFTLGIISYFSIIIAYRAFSNTILRDTALFSSLILTFIGIPAYVNQIPQCITFAFILLVLSSLWLITMNKRFGLPIPLYPIRILLGLACITSTYIIACFDYTTISNGAILYWTLFTSFVLFIIGLQLILSGFGLTVIQQQCLPEKE